MLGSGLPRLRVKVWVRVRLRVRDTPPINCGWGLSLSSELGRVPVLRKEERYGFVSKKA